MGPATEHRCSWTQSSLQLPVATESSTVELLLTSRRTVPRGQCQVLGSQRWGGLPCSIPPRVPLLISEAPLIRHEWSSKEANKACERLKKKRNGVLASEWGTGRLGEVSRSCGCELLFGDGAVKDALDGGPGVSDGEWRIVCVFRAVADELLGVISRAACGLQDERGKVDVWISVEFALLSSLGHVTWARSGLPGNGVTMATSRCVVVAF